MRQRILVTAFFLLSMLGAVASASSLSSPANRVFVSARSGSDANSCDNIVTPCQTFAGAVLQLNPGGEAIVLDSGGYGPVTITKSVTIEAPAGVTAFIHPPSGDAITINAGTSDTVTLRGLVLNGGANNGITVNTVGTLTVQNCFITRFAQVGIAMNSSGQLNVKETDVKACNHGVEVSNSSGLAVVSLDHCHLDADGIGYLAGTTSPGGSFTKASHSTANGNASGWACGSGTSGQDVLSLEFCTGSQNTSLGLLANSTNAQSAARYSNCVFTNNNTFGVRQLGAGTVETRGNNTITGNGSGSTSGTIGTFPPM